MPKRRRFIHMFFLKIKTAKRSKCKTNLTFKSDNTSHPRPLRFKCLATQRRCIAPASLAVALTGNSNNGFHCFQFLLCAHHNCVLKTELPQLSLRLFLSSALQNQMKENDELNFKSYFMYSEHCLKGGT